MSPDRGGKGVSDVNRVLLTGRITTDVQLRTARGGTVLATLRLAVPRRKRQGEDMGAVFIDVVCFDKQAENCAKYLCKGSRIGIDGRLEYSEWETSEGQRRSKHEIVAQEVQFLDMRVADIEMPTADEDEPAPSAPDADTADPEVDEPTIGSPARTASRSTKKELAGVAS